MKLLLVSDEESPYFWDSELMTTSSDVIRANVKLPSCVRLRPVISVSS